MKVIHFILLCQAPVFGFSQKIIFDVVSGIVSPYRVDAGITNIDSVKKHYGMNYTLKKDYNEITIMYEDKGLAFAYLQADTAGIVWEIWANEKSGAQIGNLMAVGKIRARDVLRKFPTAKLYQSRTQGFYLASEDLYFYYDKPGNKMEVDSDVIINKIKKNGWYHSPWPKRNNFYDYIKRKIPENNCRMLIDSLFSAKYINLSAVDLFLDKYDYGEKYYTINFQKYHYIDNDFGCKNVWGHIFLGPSGERINCFFMTKRDTVVFYIMEEEKGERKVVVKNKELFDKVSGKYKQLYGIPLDLSNPTIAPVSEGSFYGFGNKDFPPKENFTERDYKNASFALRSLCGQQQAKAIGNFFDMKKTNKRIEEKEMNIIEMLGRSGKATTVHLITGCFSKQRTVTFKNMVKRFKEDKQFPKDLDKFGAF